MAAARAATFCRPRDSRPGVVYDLLTRAKRSPSPCAALAPRATVVTRWSRRGEPGSLRPRQFTEVSQSRQARGGPHGFRLLQPSHPVFPGALDPTRTKVMPAAFLHLFG